MSNEPYHTTGEQDAEPLRATRRNTLFGARTHQGTPDSDGTDDGVRLFCPQTLTPPRRSGEGTRRRRTRTRWIDGDADSRRRSKVRRKSGQRHRDQCGIDRRGGVPLRTPAGHLLRDALQLHAEGRQRLLRGRQSVVLSQRGPTDNGRLHGCRQSERHHPVRAGLSTCRTNPSSSRCPGHRPLLLVRVDGPVRDLPSLRRESVQRHRRAVVPDPAGRLRRGEIPATSPRPTSSKQGRKPC